MDDSFITDKTLKSAPTYSYRSAGLQRLLSLLQRTRRRCELVDDGIVTLDWKYVKYFLEIISTVFLQ